MILMFHDVVSSMCPISGFQTIGSNQYRLDKETFERFIESINRLNIDTVYTFDDGGVSFQEIIAPILEKNRKHGVFCITTSCIGTFGFLSEDQIRALDANGHIIASHSHTHPQDISKLSEKELYDEWHKSKEILENILGKHITTASIPGGAVSKKVIRALFETGYSVIYTSEPSSVKQIYKDGIVIGRFAIKNSTSDIELHQLFNSLFYKNKLLLKYRILQIVKSLMGSNYNVLKQKLLKVFRI